MQLEKTRQAMAAPRTTRSELVWCGNSVLDGTARRHDAHEEKRKKSTSPATRNTTSVSFDRHLTAFVHCRPLCVFRCAGTFVFVALIFSFHTMANQQIEQAYEKYRYEALFGVWLVVTGATFMRIRRQPYSTRLKVEQYESIFKGTSLGAIVLGIGMSPKRGMRRVA